MPTHHRTDLQIVRRWSLAGLLGGVALSLCIVPVELNYLGRRDDGSIGPRASSVFAVVEKGPDGKFVAGPLPPLPRPLFWHEKLAYGVPSAIPYLLLFTLIGYIAGRVDVRVRAAGRNRLLGPEEADYDDSMSTNLPPTST